MESKSHSSVRRRLGLAVLLIIVILLAGGVIAVLIRGNRSFFMKNKSSYLISRGLYQEALALLGTLHQQYPSDPAILSQLLVIHNHLRNYEEAFDLATQLERMGKLDKEVYWALGIHSLLVHDYEAARSFFGNFPISDSVSREGRDTYRIPFVQGIIAYLVHDYESAEPFLIRALNEGDSSYLTHFYLAQAYIKRDRIDQAKDFLNLTTGKFPKQAEPFVLLASLYYQEGDIDHTKYCLDSARFLGVDAYDTLLTNTSTTSGLHVHEDCGECFRQLVDGRIYAAGAYYGRRVERMYAEILLLLRGGKLQEAKEQIEALLRIKPQLPGVNYLMALIAEQTDGAELAKKSLQKEIEINPWNYNAYLKCRRLSPGASDSQTSPAILLVRKNLESRITAEKLTADFVYDKENNSRVKALVSNGTARTSAEVLNDGIYLLTIVARGVSAGGIWPLMHVKVDESAAQVFYTDSPDWTAYSVPIDIRSGSHMIEIAFANDMIVKVGNEEEDCNLFIDRILLLDVPSNGLFGQSRGP